MFRKKSQVFIPVFIVLESFSHKLLKEKSGNQAKSYWILTRVDSVLRLVLMGLNWARATLVCIANPSKASSFVHSCVSRLYNNTHTHTQPKMLSGCDSNWTYKNRVCDRPNVQHQTVRWEEPGGFPTQFNHVKKLMSLKKKARTKIS